MAKVQVHNISDRPNTPGDAVSIILGGQKLRPGGLLEIDDSVLNSKHRELHGTRIWIGELPNRFVRTSRSALAGTARERAEAEVDRALTLEEARSYLNDLAIEDLLEMVAKASPPVDFPATPSKPALVSRFSRALFQTERELDPETFFWLGRWKRVRGGFTLKE
jgi:hypothetical protein